MNRFQIVFSLAIAAGISAFSLAACNRPQGGAPVDSSTTSAGEAPIDTRIAYVNIDSFEAHYESLKAKKDEFKTQQASMEGELQRSAQQMQADYASVMRKQQEGTLTRAEAEEAEKRLGQMQQSLETRRAAMSSQFQDKLDAFNEKLRSDMDSFLEQYSREHHFDYVLSYSRSNSQILYANKALNITSEVIKGMNDRAKSERKSK